MHVPRLVTTAALALALAGCTPTSDAPEPTATPLFASEEEAFAAAEETYAAHLTAVNDVDLSDPTTFEAVYQWMTDDALAGLKKDYTTFHAGGRRVEGDAMTVRFVPLTYDVLSGSSRVSALVCVDNSDVEVRDSEGSIVLPRAEIRQQTVEVHFVPGSSVSALKISRIQSSERDACQ